MKNFQKFFSIIAITVLVSAFAFIGCKNNSDDDEDKVTNINVMYLVASVPNIISAIELCKDSNSPTIFYQERDICYLASMPENVIAEGTLLSGQINFAIKKDIREAKRRYPDADFTFYVNDTWIGALPLEFFDRQGITNYKVKLLTDGGGSFGSNVFGKTDTKEKYDEIDLEEYYDSTAMVERNGPSGDDISFAKYCMKLALEDSKYQWVVQYADLLKEYTDDDEIKELIDKGIKDGKILDYNIRDVYNSLSNNEKAKLKKAMVSPKVEELLTPSEGKKGMMIVGSSDSGMGNGEYQAVIKKVIDHFGTDKYEYYYKPHPVWPVENLSPYEGKSGVDFFKENNIKSIPAAVPSDMIAIIYSDCFDCGGYFGSTFVSVPPANIKFFFTKKEGFTTTIRPIDKMFEKGMLDKDSVQWFTAN